MHGKKASKSDRLKSAFEKYGPDVVDAVANITAGTLGGATAVLSTKEAYNALHVAIRDNCDQIWGRRVIQNPQFVLHGIEGDSPKTLKYLRNRWMKSLGGGAVSLIGTAGSAVTTVNTTGIARHAAAGVSTGIHLYKLQTLGKRFRRAETIKLWLETCIKMKVAKGTIRTTQLASDAIPFTPVAAGCGAAAALGKIAVQLTMEGVCASTAAHVHWRAFQESRIRGSGGPATAIVRELFSRRHYKLLGGGYDVDAFIREPCGWNALKDKLLLM